MSESTWWWAMALWCAIGASMVIWLWFEAGKADKALEAQLGLDYDLDALIEAVGQEIGRQQDFAKEAVTPISTAEFQERMRRAESLGFLDNDWPRAS